MGTNKMLKELDSLVNQLQHLEIISSMSNIEFKEFAIQFFNNVDILRKQGLKYDNAIMFLITDRHAEFSEHFENNPLYEERIQDILTELDNFCPPPRFWNTALDEYIRLKWRYR